MENQGDVALLAAPAPAASTAPKDWLISPAFDLFLVANLGWLAALLPGFAAEDGATPVSFVQMYFLTVPHRWLTLALVAFDPDRREGRKSWFLGLAIAAFLLVAGVRHFAGAFVCLILLDYLWNAWHFASQHAGVMRMYACKAGQNGFRRLQRDLLRFFVCYVLVRTAGWSTGWLEEWPGGTDWLQIVDLLVLAAPVALLLSEFHDGLGRRPAKRAYMLSVCGLYACLLLALSRHHTPLVLSLTVAAAWFHALEYLAVVTIYSWRRQSTGTSSYWRTLARHWLQVLAAFVVVLGCVAVLAEKRWGDWWVGLNLWAALLHYAYDGMIWKLRRTATAHSLGIDVRSTRS